MTTAPSGRRRGRPVSEESRQAVLAAAADLLDEKGYSRLTVDEIARRSGVSKATIYKHWTGGYDVAVAAYGLRVTDAVPTIQTGDALADLTSQILRLAAFYASPHGKVIAQLLAAGTGQPRGPELLQERFFAPRRSATIELIERGKADGQLRQDVPTQLVIDLLFGPIVFRLFNGEPPLDEGAAKELARITVASLAAS
jgi:AcrR family transcriptional regulator